MVISKFIRGAREVEVDAVAKSGKVAYTHTHTHTIKMEKQCTYE